jgi:hypothetical protein
LPFYIASFFTRKTLINFIKFIEMGTKKILYTMSVRTFVIPFYYGSGSGTVINYGSRSSTAISYGSGSGTIM